MPFVWGGMTSADNRTPPPTTVETPDGATFEHLRKRHTVLATTFRRDGTPVATPVSLAVDPDDPTIAYLRTWSTSGKAKRLRRDPRIAIAPSTVRGRPTGPPVEATALLLSGDRDRYARRLLGRKHPVLHGVLVPLGHRLHRYHTQHYELHTLPDAETGDHRGTSGTATAGAGSDRNGPRTSGGRARSSSTRKRRRSG